MQKSIIDFWEKSIKGTLKDFAFDKFFIEFIEKLRYKLASHGQLKFNDYIKCINKYYDLKLLKKFEYRSKHIKMNITYKDIIKDVFFKRYIKFKYKYCNSKICKKMLKVYNELIDYSKLSHTNRVLLVDKCISLQHNSNFIVGLDVVKMRGDFENGRNC